MTDTKPLVDHAVSREETALRERILIGHLQPGDRLEADQLSSEFRVDSATIQEAISQLSTEGFVGIIPGQHMVVLGMPPQDVVDNVALFAALTGQAAELATARMTKRELAELTRLANPNRRKDDIVASNFQFHRTLNLACRSP